MQNSFVENIKNFLDVFVFFTILGIGLFMIFVDYPYFKKVGYEKDKKVTLAIGITYIVGSFVLVIITML